jgi:hypothetical protein
VTGYIHTAAIFLRSYCDELEAADPTTAAVEVATAIAAPAMVGQPRSTTRGPRIVATALPSIAAATAARCTAAERRWPAVSMSGGS